MHEKFIHGTQKFVYLLVYLTGGSSDFIPITAWNGTAKLIDTYMQKGDELAVVGQLRMRQFENKQGQNVSTIEVQVSEVTFLRKKIGIDQPQNPDEQLMTNIETLILD